MSLYIDGVLVTFGTDEDRRKQRVITFKADPELIEKLDRLAKLRGKTRSELIREAIQALVNEDLVEPCG